MLPEPIFPVRPDEFIGRHTHLDAFDESLRQNTTTGRMASSAVLVWGIGKSSLFLKPAATCCGFRIQPVTTSASKGIPDYMRFTEAICDWLAQTLFTSDSVAPRVRVEIENWKLTRVSVGAMIVDRQSREYFLGSGSALLRHVLVGAWLHFIHPSYAGTIFSFGDLHNLATPTLLVTALIIRDQFQSFGIDGVNLSVCFTAKLDYFSSIRSLAEAAVRFYNKCVLEPFTLEETAAYADAVFGGTGLDSAELVEWLFDKTPGHPYFSALVSPEHWSHYHTRPFENAADRWPAVFRRLEQVKFPGDLAQLSGNEIALLRAIAADNLHEEVNPAAVVQKFTTNTSSAEKGLLIRSARGRYKLYRPLFRLFLMRENRDAAADPISGSGAP